MIEMSPLPPAPLPSNAGHDKTPGVTVINFSHPLTAPQQETFENLAGSSIRRVVNVATQCDVNQPFAKQATELVDAAGLTPEEWQSCPLAIIPPSLTAIACVVIAEIHGRAGYFIPIVRLRPRAASIPPVFDVAEILDAQGQRDQARTRR